MSLLFGTPERDLSLPAFQKLCARIREASRRPNGSVGDAEGVEMLRSLGEFLVFGEMESEAANEPRKDVHFDVFCEGNTLGACVELTNRINSSGAKIQLLQTLSILVQNVRSATSLFFLLSNNYVNQVLETILEDRMDDADLIDAFVAFCKTLALRINPRTVQFFFADRACTYCPLFEKCLLFLRADDTMVRTSAMTILLHFLALGSRAELEEGDSSGLKVGEPGTARFLNMPRNRCRVAEYLVQYLTRVHLRYLHTTVGPDSDIRVSVRLGGQEVPQESVYRPMDVLGDLQEALLFVQDVLVTVRPPSVGWEAVEKERMVDLFKANGKAEDKAEKVVHPMTEVADVLSFAVFRDFMMPAIVRPLAYSGSEPLGNGGDAVPAAPAGKACEASGLSSVEMEVRTSPAFQADLEGAIRAYEKAGPIPALMLANTLLRTCDTKGPMAGRILDVLCLGFWAQQGAFGEEIHPESPSSRASDASSSAAERPSDQLASGVPEPDAPSDAQSMGAEEHEAATHGILSDFAVDGTKTSKPSEASEADAAGFAEAEGASSEQQKVDEKVSPEAQIVPQARREAKDKGKDRERLPLQDSGDRSASPQGQPESAPEPFEDGFMKCLLGHFGEVAFGQATSLLHSMIFRTSIESEASQSHVSDSGDESSELGFFYMPLERNRSRGWSSLDGDSASNQSEPYPPSPSPIAPSPERFFPRPSFSQMQGPELRGQQRQLYHRFSVLCRRVKRRVEKEQAFGTGFGFGGRSRESAAIAQLQMAIGGLRKRRSPRDGILVLAKALILALRHPMRSVFFGLDMSCFLLLLALPSRGSSSAGGLKKKELIRSSQLWAQLLETFSAAAAALMEGMAGTVDSVTLDLWEEYQGVTCLSKASGVTTAEWAFSLYCSSIENSLEATDSLASADACAETVSPSVEDVFFNLRRFFFLFLLLQAQSEAAQSEDLTRLNRELLRTEQAAGSLALGRRYDVESMKKALGLTQGVKGRVNMSMAGRSVISCHGHLRKGPLTFDGSLQRSNQALPEHLYLVLDDAWLILATPDLHNVTQGNLICCAPLQHCDTTSDRRNGSALLIGVRSNAVYVAGASSPELDRQVARSELEDVKSRKAPCVRSLESILGSRVAWNLSLVFEAPAKMTAARMHLDTNKLRIRNAKISKIRELLEMAR